MVEYRDIEGFPGYRVGSDGTLWSRRAGGYGSKLRDDWRQKRLTRRTGGYLGTSLFRGGEAHDRLIHRLILEAFVGPRPEGMECRHLDGDPTNNRPENLQWATHAENIRDRAKHGTVPRGEKNTKAKLTEQDVIEIRRRLKGRGSSASVAREFGVTQQLIYRIINRICWAHIPEQ